MGVLKSFSLEGKVALVTAAHMVLVLLWQRRWHQPVRKLLLTAAARNI